jgi:hypothetical protein
MAISFADRVTISPDVMFRTVGDEAVLMNLKTELYLGLDPVGTRMWEVLTKSASIEEAFDALLSEYDVEAGRLRIDLEEFIGRLIEEELIEMSPCQPTGSGALPE